MTYGTQQNILLAEILVNGRQQLLAHIGHLGMLHQTAGRRRIAAAAINSCIDRHGCDWYEIKNRIKDDITRFLYTRTKRKPMILPIVMDV